MWFFNEAERTEWFATAAGGELEIEDHEEGESMNGTVRLDFGEFGAFEGSFSAQTCE